MFRKQISIYIIIFLAAFLFRLISVFNYTAPLGGDEVSYNTLAHSIVEDGKYFNPNESHSRPPAYPFFIGIFYFIFGYKLIAVRIAQAVLDSLLCVLIYKLCYGLYNRSVALIASFSAVIYLLFISGVSRFLTESFFTFLLFLAVSYIYKTKEKLTYVNMCILGIAIALLALTKAITVLFLPFLFLVLIIARYYHFMSIKKAFKGFLVIFIAFLIPISIWTYRNYKVYGAIIPISTQSGYAFYSCYFPRDGKVYGVNAGDDNVSYAASLNSEIEMGKYLQGKVFEFIKKHPFKVLKLELLKIFYFWVPFDWEIMGKSEGVYNFQYMFMLPFSLLGMFLLLRRFDQYAPLYIPIAYLFLMSLIFYGSPRLRMPIEPYLIIFFAVGIFRFFKMFKNKYTPAVISVSYFFINFMMFLYSDSAKILFKNGAKYLGVW